MHDVPIRHPSCSQSCIDKYVCLLFPGDNLELSWPPMVRDFSCRTVSCWYDCNPGSLLARLRFVLVSISQGLILIDHLPALLIALALSDGDFGSSGDMLKCKVTHQLRPRLGKHGKSSGENEESDDLLLPAANPTSLHLGTCNCIYETLFS